MFHVLSRLLKIAHGYWRKIRKIQEYQEEKKLTFNAIQAVERRKEYSLEESKKRNLSNRIVSVKAHRAQIVYICPSKLFINCSNNTHADIDSTHSRYAPVVG